ncbi:pyruvate kinase alpha/beta domain-containing protein [Chloroflexota bacterium]
MSEINAPCVYYTLPGAGNTERTLELAHKRARSLGIRKVLVASTSGATGARAIEVFRGLDVVVVTHSTGFSAPDTQKLTDGNRSAIEAAGATLLTCQHAFGGVGRAVRKKLGTYQIDEIMAYTLRTFSEGIKVVAELALMAADAGLVRTDEAVVAIAGSGGGADTAAVLKPSNAQTFFDLQFLEIICMPSPNHPQSSR